MAPKPLVSATSLATGLDIASSNAVELLDGFCPVGLAADAWPGRGRLPNPTGDVPRLGTGLCVRRVKLCARSRY